MEVYRNLGSGLLESSYQKCLQHELQPAVLTYEAEMPMPLVYKEITLDQGYRIDLLVLNNVVVELKAVNAILAVHQAQILTYMKLSGYPLGLLINFNIPLLKNGIKRFINT